MGQEARRRQRPTRGVGEHEAHRGPACAYASMCAASSEAVNGEIVIDRTPAAVFGSFRRYERSWSCTSCSVTRIFRFLRSTLAAPQSHQLAPSHTGVDGDVDQCSIALVVGLGETDHFVPVEERHLTLRDAWRIDALARVGQDLLLLHGDLEHAAKGAVVAMNGRRRDVRRRSRRSASSRSRRPAVDRVGTRRSAAARTCRDRGGRSPASSVTTDGRASRNSSAQTANGVSALRGSTHRPRTRSASISRRNRSASALRANVRDCTLPSGSANRARYFPRCFSMCAIGTSEDGARGERGVRGVDNGGYQWLLVVTNGHCRSQRKEPLTWDFTRSEAERRRWESNPCTGLCRHPLPVPKGQVTKGIGVAVGSCWTHLGHTRPGPSHIAQRIRRPFIVDTMGPVLVCQFVEAVPVPGERAPVRD